MIAELPLVQELFGYKEVMAIPVGAIGAIAGLASAGINAYMSYRDKRRAERALAALGPRKSLTTPKEILGAYEDRLKRSTMYQGFSQGELNKMRSDQARQNATTTNKFIGLGSSPMALQAIAANTDARNWSKVEAQNADMNRRGQAVDRAAANQLAGTVSQYGYNIAAGDQAYRDLVEKTLGTASARQGENISNMFSGIGQFGMTMATSPELWGSGSSNRIGSAGGGIGGIGSTSGGFNSPGLLNRNSSIFQPLNFG